MAAKTGVYALETVAEQVAPLAAVQPVSHQNHGDVRVDHYFWLRERDNPAVLAYLEAENRSRRWRRSNPFRTRTTAMYA